MYFFTNLIFRPDADEGSDGMIKQLLEKGKESLLSTLPIILIVLLLHLTIAPMTGSVITLFILGAIFLIVGMSLFNLGADMAMMPMGEIIGENLTKTRKLPLICAVCFAIGVLVNMFYTLFAL